jgi:plastocyanin
LTSLPDDPGRTKAGWARLAALGLLMSASGALLLLVALVTFDLNPEKRPLLLIVGLVVAAAALVVRRFGSWGKLVGLAAAVAMVVTLHWTWSGVRSFPSFFDFMPGVLVVPGAIVAFFGCITGLLAVRRGRRGRRLSSATGAARSATRVIVAAVALTTVVSGVLTVTSRSTVGATPTAASVDMKSFHFTHKIYRLRAGSVVLVRNDDPFVHSFTVDALDVDKRTNPGDRVLVHIPSQTGTFILYCKLHTFDPEHPRPDDMAAQIVVE